VRRAAVSIPILVLLAAFAPGRAQDAPTPLPTATCTFMNPSYAGKCVETADVTAGSSAQHACESILRCLNDADCPKTYCRATEIRTGWRLESATAK
jgi:hypothetical protein